MIEIVASVDTAESTELLLQLLNSPRATWSMASMQVLCKFQHHAAIDEILKRMDSESFDENYGYRFALARGLKDMKHPDAWDGLAKLFDRVDGQLAHRLEQEFQGVTAEAFDHDVERFEQWQRNVGLTPAEEPVLDTALARAVQLLENEGDPGSVELPMPEKKSLSPNKSASSYARERKLTPSKYYGIDIYAKRLLFIIDRSGSMNHVVYGQTRIQKAKRELITAINGLDERCEFSVLVFDTDVRAWRTNLVQATDENKRDAAKYVSKLTTGSSTNTYGALRMGIEFDPQLEAIFLLTDG
ncbi:MAG: VWA domain-containing protein, partial [Planctomycetota bacterium]